MDVGKVLVFGPGSGENQPRGQKEQIAAMQTQAQKQNGVPETDKVQGSDEKGGIGDGDFD